VEINSSVHIVKSQICGVVFGFLPVVLVLVLPFRTWSCKQRSCPSASSKLPAAFPTRIKALSLQCLSDIDNHHLQRWSIRPFALNKLSEKFVLWCFMTDISVSVRIYLYQTNFIDKGFLDLYEISGICITV